MSNKYNWGMLWLGTDIPQAILYFEHKYHIKAEFVKSSQQYNCPDELWVKDCTVLKGYCIVGSRDFDPAKKVEKDDN